MSKLTSLIRRAPKRFSALVAIAAAVVIVPAAVLAWGPNRDTYTIEKPATKVTFNSITNNPNYGDERNFVTIKDASNTAAGGWKDELAVQAGKEYLVRMYVHNNAAANLNLVAKDVTAKFNLPTYESNRIQIDGYLSSSNADPKQVWDQAVFTSADKFSLDYVEGSALYTNNVFTSGKKLGDSVVSSGAMLGYDKLDGKIPGCFKYSGIVTFKVKALKSSFDVQKTVRVNGASDTTFKETVNAKAGDKLDYQIYFKNTGNKQLKDVVVKDALPAGVTYVPGTTYLYNANGLRQVADGITTSGLNIGGYLSGSEAYLKFTAKITTQDKLKCGTNTLKNIAKVTTAIGSKEDSATTTVNKECKPEAKYACKALGVTMIDRTNFRFTTSYTAENATFKSVTYVIKNAAGQTVDTKTSTSTTLNYSQSTVGKYTVQATVTFTVDGKDKTATSDACKGAFEVKKEDKDIKVCELATKKIITIKESQFDTSKHSKNLDDCKEIVKNIKVCELATKKIITINEKDFDASKHSKNLDDCKEIVKKIEVCELATKKIITINEKDFDASKHSKNLKDCEEVVKKIKVCELETKKIITINEKDFDASKHSKNLKDCEEVVKTIEVCEITTKKIVTINEKDFDASKHTKDLSKCEETPVTPPELPQTGAGESIVAIVGLGSLIASAAYYVASRRALNQ